MRIAALRRERGWTQERLAAASGVGVRTIQRLEAGDEGSLETMRRVAAALEVPVHDLFDSPLPAEGPAAVAPTPAARRRAPSGRRRASILIGALALVGLLVGVAAGIARPTGFESSTRAFVSVGSGTTLVQAQERTSAYVRQVAEADASLAVAPIVLDRAASRLGADGRDLQRVVAARVEPNTVVLVISARGGTPATAARRADAVMQSLIEVIPAVSPDGGAGGQRVSRLDSPTTSVDPMHLGAIAGGGGIGLGGGVLVGLLLLPVRRRPLPPTLTGRVALP